MKVNQTYYKITTDETLRETVSHGSEEYPFCYYLEDIWMFDFHCIDWHWHPEVEFVYLEKGNATLLIGSSRYLLTAGNGIFINTQVIHRFESTNHAIIPNIVFSPTLLSPEESLIYQKYVKPLLNSCIECLFFSPDIPWQKEILNLLLSVFALQESEKNSEMQTVQLLLKLWNILYNHLQIPSTSPTSKSDARMQAKLQIMMQYIHSN